MAPKFLVPIAAVIALLVLAEASSRYTVTTTVEEINQAGRGGGRQQPSEQCRQQIQEHVQQLDTCAGIMYMGSMGSRGRSEQQERLLGKEKEQCCETLRKINDQQCRCEAISEIVRWIITGPHGQWGTEEQKGKIRQSGSNLPRTCNLQHECQMQQLNIAVF
ncbi:hypothetical protein M9H77_00300 [Catharanthus roseus]|nr:hypothetical protein M9H77_00300 [Catharanthus roseus]